MLTDVHFYVAFFLLFNKYEQGASFFLLSEIDKSVYSSISMERCFDTVNEFFFNSKKDIVIAVSNRGPHIADFAKYVSGFKYKTRWTSYTTNIFNISKIPRCYDKNYILEVQDLKGLIITLQFMKKSNCWNPNQHIYIYSMSILEISMFRSMVNYVNQQHLINVVIMSPLENQTFEFYGYKMDSKNNEKCAVIPKSPEIFTCSLGNITTSLTYNNTSPCTLKIKAIVWPPFVIIANHSDTINDKPVEKYSMSGFETELVNLISESLRIKIEYYPSLREDWGRSFFNGTTTETMHDFIMKKIDVAIGSFTTSLSRTLLVRSTFPYSEEYVVCCVASNAYIDVWSTLINTLQLFFSILIMYSIMTTIIWVISRHCEENHRSYRNASTCYLYCFGMLVGVSVKVLPQTRNARMFVILLLIFEFFYVAFYESILTSVLLRPNWNEDIKTFKDIVDRNMNIYNEPENRRYFEHIENEFGEKALSLWIDCHNVTNCLEDVQKNRNKAICLGKMHKDFITSNKGNPSVSCIRHAVMTYPVVMLMRKALPFHKKINKIIRECLSAGLVEKWITTSFYKRSITYVNETNSSGNLGFRDLKPVFVVLIVGHLVASVLAAAEITYCNWNLLSGILTRFWVLKFRRVLNNIC